MDGSELQQLAYVRQQVIVWPTDAHKPPFTFDEVSADRSLLTRVLNKSVAVVYDTALFEGAFTAFRDLRFNLNDPQAIAQFDWISTSAYIKKYCYGGGCRTADVLEWLGARGIRANRDAVAFVLDGLLDTAGVTLPVSVSVGYTYKDAGWAVSLNRTFPDFSNQAKEISCGVLPNASWCR